MPTDDTENVKKTFSIYTTISATVTHSNWKTRLLLKYITQEGCIILAIIEFRYRSEELPSALIKTVGDFL